MSDRKEKINLLFGGFIREIEITLDKDQLIPHQINDICISYYDLYVPYQGKFIKDANIASFFTLISEREIKLKGTRYRSAKMNLPIMMNQNLIYRWKMSISHGMSWSKDLDTCDFIGVVSNKCDNIGWAPWGNLIDCYGISGRRHYVYLGTKGNFQKDDKYETTIAVDQIVTIELDCDLHEILFKLKDKLIYGPIKLPKRQSWYPAVSLTLGNFNYRCNFIPF